MMTDKSIWYVNQYAGGPGLNGAYRAYELCRHWNSSGTPSLVILGSFNSPNNQINHYEKLSNVNGVDYLSIKTNKYHGNGFGRILSILLFSVKLFFISSKIPNAYKKPKCIIISTVHPFGIFAGKYLAKKHNAKLVFEVRDLWPLTLRELLEKPVYSPLVVASSIAQNFALKHAHIVSSVLPKADRYFRSINRMPNKFLWVPNGVSKNLVMEDRDSSLNIQSITKAIREWKDDGRTIFVHAGAIGPPNAVDKFVDAAIELLGRGKKVACLLIGEGILKEEIIANIPSQVSSNFYFTGGLTKEETQHLLNYCDIGYAGINNLPRLYCYGISLNKIPSYYDASLPVLLPIAPCGDAISESRGGVAEAVQGKDDLVRVMENMMSLNRAELREMGERGKKYTENNYNYQFIAKNYLDCIDEGG